MSLVEHHISDSELSPFFNGQTEIDDSVRAAALIRQQSDPDRGWPRLIKNVAAYSRIKKDVVNVQGVDVVVTLNETRAPSVTAKTFEAGQVESRPCFLCNLDKEQRGILTLDSRYIILANPGITVPGDLTIAAVKHEPQIIAGSFADMITLAKTLTGYSIFFNGAMAGASSPHFHFQAGVKDTLIGERQIDRLLSGLPVGAVELIPLYEGQTGRLYFLRNYLRATYLSVTNDSSELNRIFQIFYRNLQQINQQIRNIPHVPDFGLLIPSLNREETEPRMNLMLKYDPETATYLLVMFPKIFNRPGAYFKTGAGQLIVGMAIKESLGNLISCRTADYENLLRSPELITGIYNDTSISESMIDELNEKLVSGFTSEIG